MHMLMMGIYLVIAVTPTKREATPLKQEPPFKQELLVLQETNGPDLALRKRRALLRLSESDDTRALKILHHFHYQLIRKPESLTGLSAKEVRDLRYFAQQLLKMKNASERLVGNEDVPEKSASN